jgi:3-dehydrosphinganine reductase
LKKITTPKQILRLRQTSLQVTTTATTDKNIKNQIEHKKHVLITGGSSGIGLAIAKQIATKAKNSHITIVARDPEKLATAKALIEAACLYPDQQIVLAIAADVRDQTQVAKAIKDATDLLGPLDLLVLCAGEAYCNEFEHLELKDHRDAMDVNYFGSLYAVHAALPHMTTGSNVVFLSSGVGLIGFYGYTAYAPSKFAIRGLAEALRGETKKLGISVHIVYPGDTDTAQLRKENLTKPPITKELSSSGGMLSPEKVAALILRGIEQGKFEVTTGGIVVALLLRFHSLVSPVLRLYENWVVEKHQQFSTTQPLPPVSSSNKTKEG